MSKYDVTFWKLEPFLKFSGVLDFLAKVKMKFESCLNVNDKQRVTETVKIELTCNFIRFN